MIIVLQATILVVVDERLRADGHDVQGRGCPDCSSVSLIQPKAESTQTGTSSSNDR